MLKIKNYTVELKGTQPLLMHLDNVQFSDDMKAWEVDPNNKKTSKAGDDRTPSWRWIGCLPFDSDVVSIPAEYIMSTIMKGAAGVSVGRGAKTFKEASQSSIIAQESFWPLLVNGKEIPIESINACRELETFAEQRLAAEKMGFQLFVKRAKIGQAKHVRVRPMFRGWSTVGKLTVTDEQITKLVLEQILEISGRYKGLGDWRPGGKTPGQYGTFEAQVSEA